MSANQSNLSDSHFGYDFVIATTQESINATIQQYLYNTEFPVVKMYWNQDDQGNPVSVSYEDLMRQTNGTNPLTVPSWSKGDPMSQDIQNIKNSNFYFAFEASIGVPKHVAPADIPTIVALQPASQSVLFSLICSQFTIVTCNFGRHGLLSYFNTSQKADTPWLFNSIVPLMKIIDNTALPPAVRQQLDNFGPDAFSVQQLLFDLDNAALESTPTISGVDPGTPAHALLTQAFVNAYFSAMQTTAQPILGYTIMKNMPPQDPSSLVLTDMAMEVSQYKDPNTKSDDAPNLNTLNYLCAANGNVLPPSTSFDWNWVEKTDGAGINGAVSINRNTFAKYFQDQLTPYVMRNCYLASVRVWLSGFMDATVNFSWKVTGDQTPTITIPPSGAEVLSFSYSSSDFDQAGVGGDMGQTRLSPSYTASVSFSGNTIVITQNLVIAIYIRSLANSVSWNAINKTYTDTYTLAVTEQGQLTASLNSVLTDNSDPTPSTNWFSELFTNLNDMANDVAAWAANFSATTLQDMPVGVAQQFVFPGGDTFAFKDVSFSDYQDLVSRISYAQPG